MPHSEPRSLLSMITQYSFTPHSPSFVHTNVQKPAGHASGPAQNCAHWVSTVHCGPTRGGLSELQATASKTTTRFTCGTYTTPRRPRYSSAVVVAPSPVGVTPAQRPRVAIAIRRTVA